MRAQHNETSVSMIPSVLAYFSPGMACVPHTSYFDSPDFIADTLNILIWFEVPVLSFGGYCILFKTPSNMSSVKWLMLNMHFWTSMFDLATSFFGVPYVMFPALAGWGLGVVQLPGFIFFSSVILLGGEKVLIPNSNSRVSALSASVVSIYENRYHRLFGQKTWWSRVRKPFLVFMFLFAPTFFIPTYFYIPDQELARKEVVNSLPCIPSIIDKPMYVLSLDLLVPFVCFSIAATVFGPSWTIFSILIFWNILYNKKFSNSLRTNNMQKKFAVAISIQVSHGCI